MPRITYKAAFKAKIVKSVNNGMSIKEASKKFGGSKNSIQGWRLLSQNKKPFPPPGFLQGSKMQFPTPDSKGNQVKKVAEEVLELSKILKKENDDLKAENTILLRIIKRER